MDRKSFYRILILVVFAVVVGGGILVWQYWPSEEQKPTPVMVDETVGWKTYSNPEVKFTFKYPEDWEVKSDYFYETAAGSKAINPTIILGPKGIDFQSVKQTADEKVIVINMRQYSCFGSGWGQGLRYADSSNFRWLPPNLRTEVLPDGQEVVIDGANFVATCSKNLKILEIFKEIADSFKATE